MIKPVKSGHIQNKELKNIKLAALLLLELAALMFVFYKFHPQRQVVQITKDTMESMAVDAPDQNREGITEKGYYIDSSYPGQHRLMTPVVLLDMGVYDVTLDFATGNPIGTGKTGCQSYAVTTYQHPWVRSGVVRLMDYMAPNTSYRIWVDRDKTPVQVVAEMTDDYETWLMLTGVTITYYAGKTTAVYMTLIVILCLLIDIPIALKRWLPKTQKDWLKDRQEILLAVLIIGFAASIPVLSNYIMFGYDTNFHMNRIKAIAMGLQNGYFPVKVHPGWLNGYGYATGIYYCDFFLYLPALLYLMGFTIMASYRVYVIFMNLLSAGIAAYSFTKISGSRRIGIMGSAVYNLSLFRLGCIYTWCQIGTVGAMAFFPFVMLGLWRIYGDDLIGGRNIDQGEAGHGKSGWIALALGMTGAMYSHVVGVLILLVFLIAFALVFHRITFRREILLAILKAAVLCAVLVLWYAVPFVDSYLHNELVEVTMYRPFTLREVQLSQIFSNVYETISDQRQYNELSSIQNNSVLTYGMMAAVILMIGVYVVTARWKSVYRKFLYVVLTAAVVLVVLSTNMFPYKRLIEIPFFVSIFDRLEYPWRFMPLGTLMIAMVFVAVCMILSDQERVKGMLIMMVVCLITCVHGVQYEDRYMHDASQMLFSYDVDEVVMRNIMGGEFLLKGQTEFTDRIIRFDQSVPATAQIISRRGIHIESRIDNSSEDALNLDYPLTGYYGYRAWTTGKEPAEEPANTTMDSRKTGEKRQYLPVTASEDGRLRVTVPENFHGDVTVDFVESPLWRVSELISMIGAVILLLVIYRNMSSIFGRVGT